MNKMRPAARRVPVEIEAKFLVQHAADLRAIARLDHLGPYRLRPRGTVRLHSLYVDTRERALARQRVALRLRRQAGRWEATAKWSGRVRGTVHQRPELTVRLRAAPRMPFIVPDGPLREHLSALVGGGPLTPILRTLIHRTRFDVLPAHDGRRPIAELALDRVTLAAPGVRCGAGARYCEVEIELLHGTPRQLATLAKLLQRQFGLLPSGESKFARGLKLLYGSTPRRVTTDF